MTKRILIATDGSEPSRRAISAGVALAKALGAAVVGCAALRVYPYHGVGGELAPAELAFQAQAAAEANRNLDEVERAAAGAGVPFSRILRDQPKFAEAMRAVAKERYNLTLAADQLVGKG